jgi:hypothetical protein
VDTRVCVHMCSYDESLFANSFEDEPYCENQMPQIFHGSNQSVGKFKKLLSIYRFLHVNTLFEVPRILQINLGNLFMVTTTFIVDIAGPR